MSIELERRLKEVEAELDAALEPAHRRQAEGDSQLIALLPTPSDWTTEAERGKIHELKLEHQAIMGELRRSGWIRKRLFEKRKKRLADRQR